MSDRERVTYRSVLANREFAALFVSQGLSTIGDQLARIAVALVVYERSGSPLAASATYAVGYLAYLLGGPVLSALSDLRPRVSVMVACDLARAPAILLLTLRDAPTWLYFVVLVLVGLLSPPFDSARSSLQPDILQGEAYRVGNGLMTIVLQAGQVFGFVLGGALVSLVSARGALAVDAATFLVSAGLVLSVVGQRPAAAGTARAGLVREAQAGYAFVLSRSDLRRFLGLSVLTSATIIAPEGLAVPTAASLGGDALMAGLLTASVPTGAVLGGLAVLRLAPETRMTLLPRLAVLSALPLLLTPLLSGAGVIALAWTAAGLGNAVTVVAAGAYMEACPAAFRARAYGVAVTTLQVVQGLVLLVAGLLADPLGPRACVAVLAALCCGVMVIGMARQGNPQGIVPSRRWSQG